MSILVINSSPNHEGNTVHLAEELLASQDYEMLHLNDYQLAQLGQTTVYDQFEQVFEKIDQADMIVFGTPIYWHDMTGSLKLLIDRISEDVAGLKHCDFMFQRFTSLSGMNYLGMVSNTSDISKLKKKAGF